MLQYHLEWLWTANDTGPNFGPTVRAVDELKILMTAKGLSQGQAPKSSKLGFSEGLLLRVAFDFWNGAGVVSVWEMLTYLEPRIIRQIASFLMECPQCATADRPERVEP